jgi:hypothetical protein
MSVHDRLGGKTCQPMSVQDRFRRENIWANESAGLFLGMPRPSVTWWREGTIYDNSYEVSPSGLVVNKMKYLNLQVMMICKLNSKLLQYTKPVKVAVCCFLCRGMVLCSAMIKLQLVGYLYPPSKITILSCISNFLPRFMFLFSGSS